MHPMWAALLHTKCSVALQCRNNWKLRSATPEADPCHRRSFAPYDWRVGEGSPDLSNSFLLTLAPLKAELVFKYQRVLLSLLPQFS